MAKNYQKRAAELLRLATTSPKIESEMLIRALADPSPLVRHVAAVELARHSPDQLPEASILELLDTLSDLEYSRKPTIAAEYEEVTATEDDSNDLGQDIVLAIASLRCGQADFAIGRLLEFWSFRTQFYELAHALLALGFPRNSQAHQLEISDGRSRSNIAGTGEEGGDLDRGWRFPWCPGS